MNEYKNIKVREVNYGFGYVMDGDLSTLTSDNVLTKLDYQFKKLKEQLKETQEKLNIAVDALEFYAEFALLEPSKKTLDLRVDAQNALKEIKECNK